MKHISLSRWFNGYQNDLNVSQKKTNILNIGFTKAARVS